MADQPVHVVVEIATPESVQKLQDEYLKLRSDFQLLQSQHSALHATVYQLMERIASSRR